MPRYLEDLAVGDRTQSRAIHLTEADSISFSEKYDPQPMHVDPVSASQSALGGLIASGWHTAALVMRLIVDARTLGGAPVLGLGVDELRWPTPVRPGDTIRAEIEVVSITPSRSKPDFGVVRTKVTVRNQKNEVVLSMYPNLWVPRRPAA